jgi:hypothetical protein
MHTGLRHAWFFALAVALLACGCAGGRGPIFKPREGQLVRAIRWEGIEAVSREELEAAILTSKANWRPWVEVQPYDPGTLEQDLERLRRVYRRKGFYEAAIRSEVEQRGTDAVAIRFFVTEGPQVVLDDFALAVASDLAIATTFDVSALARGLPLVPGEPFSAERYAKAKEKLLQRFAELGHPGAVISGGAEVRRDERTATVDWTVDPGPFVRLGPASAVGLERVKPDLVLGEIAWETGEPYRPAVLRETQRAIFDLGLFRSVSVQPTLPTPNKDERPPEEEWPIEIRVRERPPRSYRIGVGFGTEDLVRAKLEWKHRNFLGGLRSLRIVAKYSFLERGVEAIFVQPRFLGRQNKLTLDSLLLDETPPVYHTRGVSAGWLFERPGERELSPGSLQSRHQTLHAQFSARSALRHLARSLDRTLQPFAGFGSELRERSVRRAGILPLAAEVCPRVSLRVRNTRALRQDTGLRGSHLQALLRGWQRVGARLQARPARPTRSIP